jgi:hypothetical protein
MSAASRPGPGAHALLAAVAITALSCASAVAAGPLTNEDVVRMVITGTSEKVILAAIATRDVAFDLSPDVVSELRAAGVNDGIIGAMRRRQAAMPAPEPVPAPTPPAAVLGTLEVSFATDPGTGKAPERTVIALRALPKGAIREGGMEVGEMSDLALAILCTTTDHVPDHWDARTPIATGPRHELLLFRPGSVAAKERGFEILYLDGLEEYRVSLPEGNHNIQVAAAGRQVGSGDWRLLATDGARIAILAGQTTRMTLKARSAIRGSFMTGFRVDSEWTILSVRHPGEDPAGGPVPTEEGSRS